MFRKTPAIPPSASDVPMEAQLGKGTLWSSSFLSGASFSSSRIKLYSFLVSRSASEPYTRYLLIGKSDWRFGCISFLEGWVSLRSVEVFSFFFVVVSVFVVAVYLFIFFCCIVVFIFDIFIKFVGEEFVFSVQMQICFPSCFPECSISVSVSYSYSSSFRVFECLCVFY